MHIISSYMAANWKLPLPEKSKDLQLTNYQKHNPDIQEHEKRNWIGPDSYPYMEKKRKQLSTFSSIVSS